MVTAPTGRIILCLALILTGARVALALRPAQSSVVLGSQRRILADTPPASPNAVQPRIEINEIDKRPQADRYKNLLILAWQKIQEADPADAESNYQLSGIHGAPYVTFNGSNGASAGGGYCWHSSVLFPTWHRPYALLFERVLIKRAMEVADSFVNATEKAQYVALAPTIRLPYWDWANTYNDNGDFPQLLVTPTLDVVNPAAPDASTMTINNPFYQYVVPDTVDSGQPWPASIDAGQATVRDPSNSNAYVTDEQGFTQAVQASAASFASQVFNLLGAGTWDCLYNANCGLGSVDLESIHNTLHGTVGGNMGYIAASGFDPVFWMHHAQIDRVFWLWQQRWPDVWLPPRYEPTGNYYTPGGQTFDSNTELAPFWRDGNSYLTSNDVRDISALGYSYQAPAGGDPDPNRAPPLAPPAQVQGGPQQDNALCGSFFGRRRLQAPGATGSSGSGVAKQGAAAGMVTGGMGQQQAATHQNGTKHVEHKKVFGGYRWQVNFAGVDKQQLGAPFYIHIFLATLHKIHNTLPKGSVYKQPGYCGSYFQLSATNRTRHVLSRPRIDLTIDVTSCLHKAKIATIATPKVPGKPASGPLGKPVRLQDLVWVATTHSGADVSRKFDFGAPKLTWSVLVDGGRLHVGSA